MCTLKESKLFIDTINQIPVKESIEFIFDASYTSLLEEEFPVKDRSISRKHNSSRRKAKEKSRNRKFTECQRGYNLYHAGLDENGTTFKVRSKNTFAAIDEKDFIKRTVDDVAENDNNKPSNNWYYMLSHFDSNPDRVIEGIERLKAIGITFDEETKLSIIREMNKRSCRDQRISELYSEREIVGYEVYHYTGYDVITFGNFPTKEIASNVVLALINEGYDAYLSPIKMFSEEQAKELIDLKKYS